MAFYTDTLVTLWIINNANTTYRDVPITISHPLSLDDAKAITWDSITAITGETYTVINQNNSFTVTINKKSLLCLKVSPENVVKIISSGKTKLKGVYQKGIRRLGHNFITMQAPVSSIVIVSPKGSSIRLESKDLITWTLPTMAKGVYFAYITDRAGGVEIETLQIY